MTRIAAVVLAAGESRRMGAQNKLHLPVEGVPLLRKSVQTLLAAGLAEIVVVLGHQAEQSRALLAGLPISMVVNGDYQQGQMSSVHAGLQALSAACDGIMVCLSDQPWLQTADIHALIDAYTRRGHGSIVVPTWRGQRGNPIILAYEHRQAILGGDSNLGCKRLIENNPALVCSVEMQNDHCVFDVDTVADYAACTGNTVGSVSAPTTPP